MHDTIDNTAPKQWTDAATDVAILWLIFAGMYFYELASFPLSIDEELAAFRHLDPASAGVWVQQGRWGAYLFERFILPQPTIPYLPAALLGLGMAICFRVLLSTAGLRGQASNLLRITFAVFCAFPTWVFLMEFYSNAGAMGFGVALSSVSVWLIFREDIEGWKQNILHFFGGVAAATLAISVYQSLFFFIFSLGATALLLRAISHAEIRNICRNFFALLAMLFAAFVAYKVADGAFLALLGLQPEYTDQFLQIDALITDPITTLQNTVEHMAGIYGLYDHLYLTRMWTIPIVLVLGIVALFSFALRPYYDKGQKFLVLGLGIVVFFSPFLIDLISKGLPTRAIVSAPVAAWCFAYLSLKNHGMLRKVGMVAIAAAIFQLLVFSNTMSAAGHFTGINDQSMAFRLYERISAASPQFSADKQYKLVVYGGAQPKSNYPVPPWSTIGGSFFGWNGGDTTRIVPYLDLLGFDNFHPTDIATLAKYLPQMEAMPVFPAAGSAKIDDENQVVMVRLGQEPSDFNRRAEMLVENPIGFGADPSSLLFSLKDKHFTADSGDVSWDGTAINFSTRQDPQLLLDLSDKKDELAKCHKLQVSARLSTGRADWLQIFYRTPSSKYFTEANSKKLQYVEKAETYIFLKSKDGFAPDIRFDPGDGNIDYRIDDLEIRCRG